MLKPRTNVHKYYPNSPNLSTTKQAFQLTNPIRKKIHRLLTEPRPQASTKESINSIYKDFSHNFKILDINNTGFLNYSRFSILLQSMQFIEYPLHKSNHERELILKAWRLIGGLEYKKVWKANILALCLAIMNKRNKPEQSEHLHNSKISNGVTYLKKREVERIHRRFYVFFENRKRVIDSISPDLKLTLKKNLSFEDRKISLSPVESPKINEDLSPEGLKKLTENLRILKTIEKTEEIAKIAVNEADSKDNDSFNSSLNDTFSISSNCTHRVRVRLTTTGSKFPVSEQPKLKHSDTNRSMTSVDKNASFAYLDVKLQKEGEDLNRSKINIRKSMPVYMLKVSEENEDSNNMVFNIRIPGGIHEVLLVDKEKFNEEYIEELVAKNGLIGKTASEFRRQAYSYLKKRS